MARNAEKRKCAVEGCKAWAMRGSDLCASHSRAVKVGAPDGNTNALKHGAYSKDLVKAEVLTVPSIDDEISLLVARRNAVDQWLMARMEAGEEVDVLRYLALLGQIGSRIARMLKARESLGEQGDLISQLFDHALDLLDKQVEIEL